MLASPAPDSVPASSSEGPASSPTTPDPHGGHFRVSDADRDLVNTVLSTAYADGRITREEFDERSEQVLAAKTFNDLRPVTADLVAPEPVRQQYSSPVPARTDEPAAEVVVDTSHRSEGSDTLYGILSTGRRTSPGWRLHRKTSVLIGLGDVKMDLTKGVMEAEHCEIEVMIGLGDLQLIVPAGVQVIDRVTNVMGESKVVGTRPTRSNGPTITIKGMTLLGEVKVVGPDHQSFGKLMRKAAKRLSA